MVWPAARAAAPGRAGAPPGAGRAGRPRAGSPGAGPGGRQRVAGPDAGGRGAERSRRRGPVAGRRAPPPPRWRRRREPADRATAVALPPAAQRLRPAAGRLGQRAAPGLRAAVRWRPGRRVPLPPLAGPVLRRGRGLRRLQRVPLPKVPPRLPQVALLLLRHSPRRAWRLRVVPHLRTGPLAVRLPQPRAAAPADPARARTARRPRRAGARPHRPPGLRLRGAAGQR